MTIFNSNPIATVNQFLAIKTYADLTSYTTAAAFTVTGDVQIQVFGIVGAVAITSSSGTTTLSIGTTEAPVALIAATTIDNAQFDATDVWTDITPTVDCDKWGTAALFLIGGGADVILTGNVDDITAGALTLYCLWTPLSVGATVVSA